VVVASKYLVTVYLMEPYWSAIGQRVFNMTIVGSTAAQITIDIIKLAGGKGLPIIVNTTFTATASTMSITFVALAGADQASLRGEICTAHFLEHMCTARCQLQKKQLSAEQHAPANSSMLTTASTVLNYKVPYKSQG
jgi:hypothetical protein